MPKVHWKRSEKYKEKQKNTISENDRGLWSVHHHFHNLIYEKKKLVLRDMIDWAEVMNTTIDNEYGN